MTDTTMPDRPPDRVCYCASDLLHSRDLAGALRAVAVAVPSSPRREGYEGRDVVVVVVCHGDGTSWYKATRKMRRTADRIRKALPSASNESIEGREVGAEVGGARWDGCLIGGARGAAAGGATEREGAVRRRLASEFACDGARIDDVGDDDDAGRVSMELYRGEEGDPQEERWCVAFVDLDAIVSGDAGRGDAATSQPMRHYGALQRTLALLGRRYEPGTNSIVHVKSEALHRAVASVGGGSKCAIGSDVRKRCEASETASDDERSHITGTTIRRLRDNKGASRCPLTIYPPRYVELPTTGGDDGNGDCDSKTRVVEICRFHNFDAARGCLRSRRGRCDLDRTRCYRCGEAGHRALDCAEDASGDRRSSVIFRITPGGDVVSAPYVDGDPTTAAEARRTACALPSLVVIGGRLRGRTLATCERLPLFRSFDARQRRQPQPQWIPLPNLNEHRGSHAACSPPGTGLAFALGGGTADGNSDAVEVLNFGDNDDNGDDDGGGRRWRAMAGRLSCPRHAFEAVCVSEQSREGGQIIRKCSTAYAVGGWMYGAASCASVERLRLPCHAGEGALPEEEFERRLLDDAEWEPCAPLLLPRRLHSVAANADGSSIYVFGGYVDDRRTTPSVERYDVERDEWHATEKLPYGENCPLVQAVAEKGGSFLIFPFSTERAEDEDAPTALRYSPGSDEPFSSVFLPSHGGDDSRRRLRLPIANWHSFSATASVSLNKAFLVGGTVGGKWTNRSFELDMSTYQWRELPPMTFPRRRLATLVLE